MEEEVSADIAKPIRYGLIGLGLAVIIIVAWSVLAPLDEGVPAPGAVSIDTKRKPVQHLTGGIVEEVLVREAQTVHKGDGLIKLDDGVARANYEAARLRYLGLLVMQNRLQAERIGASGISFHADVRNAASDPQVREQIDTETRLFQSRRQAHANELAAMDAAIKAQDQAAASFAAQLAARKRQQGLVTQGGDSIRALVKEGYAPRNKLLDFERTSAELDALNSGLQGDYARARQNSSEITLRKLQRQQEYLKEIDAQLADIQRELAADGEKFRAASDELDRTLLRSPADGVVVGLAVQTPGSVIQPGARVMDIVPQDERLMLEARVPPHLIDRIHPGQLTDIRFSGFAHTPQLVVEGKLASVSADLLADPGPQGAVQQYYLARIEVTPKG
ncbi:MAG: HlyD family type I secretion periplasmic adaptor subunit, partial [Desulfobulbus sp.]|nr:HlyD family type I secretion periplasmic adaptor subunit [Desulfobulbus sp.]